MYLGLTPPNTTTAQSRCYRLRELVEEQCSRFRDYESVYLNNNYNTKISSYMLEDKMKRNA